MCSSGHRHRSSGYQMIAASRIIGDSDEKVALLGDPRLIEVQHDRIGRLVSVRDVGHKIAVDGVAAVRATRVVEVDDAEFRRNLIALHVGTQVVVGDRRRGRRT